MNDGPPWVMRSGFADGREWQAVEPVRLKPALPEPETDAAMERIIRRDKFWQQRAMLLPPWAQSLSNRVAHHVLCALADGDLASLHADAIRAKGEGWWLRREAFGRQAERELAAAIGGWEMILPPIGDGTITAIHDATPTLSTIRAELDTIQGAIARIEATLNRLGAGLDPPVSR